MTAQDKLKVVVAGGGVAALETVMTLGRIADGLVDVTLLAPNTHYVERAAAVAAPFDRPAQQHALAAMVPPSAATIVRDGIARVDVPTNAAITRDGRRLEYDALVIAVGATMHRPLGDVLTFLLDPLPAMTDLVLDLLEGYDVGMAVVIPPGATWPLPAYELALLTADDARAMDKHPRIVLVTPETAPLGTFGQHASQAARRMLDAAGVDLRLGTTAFRDGDGALVLAPSGERLDGLRVVAMPILHGPEVLGLPSDASGFLPVDAFGQVAGSPSVYAIGDAAAWPIKHGSLAAQQALVTARHIARRAGALVDAEPWHPLLEATLWGGSADLHLTARPSLLGTSTDRVQTAEAAESKVAAPNIAAALRAASSEPGP